MKNTVSQYRRFYLSEFSYFDGDHFITFNIVDIDTGMITVAISNEGRISVCPFDLKSDGDCLYFEYGVSFKKIAVDGFNQIGEDERYA